MEHQEAIKIQASERYLLGDLPPAQRNAFEEHFFECEVCAEDVRLGTMLADNAKAAFEDPDLRRAPTVSSRSRRAWLRWPQLVPAGAALVFALIAGIQSFQISALRQPQLAYAAVIPPASKGEQPTVHAASDNLFIELSFYVDAINAAGPYRCTLMTEAGKVIVNLKSPAPPDGAPITLRLAQSSIKPGRYIMILRVDSAGSEREVERYPFTVEKS